MVWNLVSTSILAPRSRRPIDIEEVLAAEIDIEIFGLEGPVVGEGVFEARADRPAPLGVAGRVARVDVQANPSSVDIDAAVRLDLAVRSTTGAVQEDLVPGIAEAAADGAEPLDFRAGAEARRRPRDCSFMYTVALPESSPSMPDHWKSASTPTTQLLSN